MDSGFCSISTFILIFFSLCQFFCCEEAWKLSDIWLKGAAAKETVTDWDPEMQRDQRSGSRLSIIYFYH